MGKKLSQLNLPGELISSQWFRFTDSNGGGYAQTDYYLILEDFILLIECKLTRTGMAEIQMRDLYTPLLRKIYNLPVVCLQVCKNVKGPLGPSVVSGPEVLIYKPLPGMWLWHYIGN